MTKKTNIGTIGHIDHGKTTILMLAQEAIDIGAMSIDSTELIVVEKSIEKSNKHKTMIANPFLDMHDTRDRVVKRSNAQVIAIAQNRKAEARALREYNKQYRPGMKPFEYGEGLIYSLNQKNADRKARIKGWIK